MMRPGRDYIGVGVGAMVFNARGEVFLSQRGAGVVNERGKWEFPGGKVEFGERLEAAIVREFTEEYGMQIAVIELLTVTDHILADEGQHWVAATYIARHVSGTPRIMEREKCTALGWFALAALPEPLSQVTQSDIAAYRRRYGHKAPF